MPLVQASTIINDAEIAIGWDTTQLEPQQTQMAYAAFSLALQEIWEGWWWQLLMLSGQFPAAPVYSPGTAYSAGAFVYFNGTKKFYQAMQPTTTGNDPALFAATSGNTGCWTTNYEYWAEAMPVTWGADYAVGTNDTGLALGSVVRFTDGQFYSLATYSPQVTVTGAGVAGANQTYTRQGTFESLPAYVSADNQYLITWLSGQVGPPNCWCISQNGGNPLYVSTSATATPGAATGWYSVDASQNPNPANNPVPVVADVLNAYPAPTTALVWGNVSPLDTASWGIVTPFVATVLTGATVRAVGANDPQNAPVAGDFNFEKVIGGIRIPQWRMGMPWLWYRRPTPILTGTDFDPTASYTAMNAVDLTYP